MAEFLFWSPYSKNLVPKTKAYLLSQSVFFHTKHKTEHTRPIHPQYFYVCDAWLDAFILPPKFKCYIFGLGPICKTPSYTFKNKYWWLLWIHKKQETLGILQQNLTCKVFPPDISLVIFLYIFSIVSLVFLEIFLVPKL